MTSQVSFSFSMGTKWVANMPNVNDSTGYFFYQTLPRRRGHLRSCWMNQNKGLLVPSTPYHRPGEKLHSRRPQQPLGSSLPPEVSTRLQKPIQPGTFVRNFKQTFFLFPDPAKKVEDEKFKAKCRTLLASHGLAPKKDQGGGKGDKKKGGGKK